MANKNIPTASFIVDKNNYFIDANYLFRNFSEGEKVEIIYDNQNPRNAALYSVWGYWIKWQELIFSLILVMGLFQIAIQVTKNPTPEALINELEGRKKKKKRKYSD